MSLPRLQLQQTNRPVECIVNWMRGAELEMNPPYQRGDVWGTVRRRNLIKSILLGVPIPSIIVNDRLKADWEGEGKYLYAVIDGKQRITAIWKFLSGELEVPAEWFECQLVISKRRGMVLYTGLSIAGQRLFRNMPIAMSEAALPTIEQEQEVFDLVNFGGLRQGESDTD